jgi:copper transport protein
VTGPARRRTPLLALLAALALLLLPALPASAHAVLVRTDPGPDTVLKGDTPKQVVLYFSEPVKIQFGGVRVFNSALERVDAGQPHFVDDRTVAVEAKALEDGTYIVAWRVVSADTHPIRGAFKFSVGAPSTSSGSAQEAGRIDTALSEFSSAPKSVQAAANMARSLGYLTALALFGPLVFVLVAWRPRTRGGSADRSMMRVTGRLLTRVWPAAAVASLLVLVTEAATEAGVTLVKGLQPSTLGPLLGTTFGHVWVVRMILLVGLLPLLLRTAHAADPAPADARSVGAMAASAETLEAGAEQGRPLSRRGGLWAAAALAGGVMASPAFWGHATTAENRALALVSDTAHLLSVGAWVGGLLCLLALVPRVLRNTSPDERAAALARTVPRFSKLAFASVVLLVGSGTYLAINQVGTWKGLFGTTYGKVLVAKIIGLALALVLAAFNLFRTQRRLKAAAEHPEEADVWARRLRRVVGGEALITLVVIALAAVLVSQAPPRTTAVGGVAPELFQATRVAVGPDLMDVSVYPARVGRQDTQVHLIFSTPQGLADDSIVEAGVSLTQVEEDLGPFKYTGDKAGPGHFVVENFSFPTAGTWRMEISARQGEFDEFRHTVEFPVG